MFGMDPCFRGENTMTTTASLHELPERERRPRVLKGGSILNGINNSEISCTIRNMHETGAELRVGIEALVPSRFLLYVPLDGKAYNAEIRWRVGDRMGVHFLGETEKPHWHYG